MSVKMPFFITLCFYFVDVEHDVQRCEELSLGRQIGVDGEETSSIRGIHSNSRILGCQYTCSGAKYINYLKYYSTT